MIVEPIVIIILGIVFTTLSITDRTLFFLKKKGLLLKLYNTIHTKKLDVAESIKLASSMIDGIEPNKKAIKEVESDDEEYNENVINLGLQILELVKN